MHKIQFKLLKSVPWKNNQGSTRQVLIYPEDADLSNFLWRISMADITQEGVFSSYPDTTRSLCILSGDHLVLNINQEKHDLFQVKTIVRFDGGANTSVLGCVQPVLDFGVISRNSHFDHELCIINSEIYHRSSPQTLICALNTTPTPLYIGDNQITLDQYDSLYLSENDPLNVINQSKAADLLIVEFNQKPL